MPRNRRLKKAKAAAAAAAAAYDGGEVATREEHPTMWGSGGLLPKGRVTGPAFQTTITEAFTAADFVDEEDELAAAGAAASGDALPQTFGERVAAAVLRDASATDGGAATGLRPAVRDTTKGAATVAAMQTLAAFSRQPKVGCAGCSAPVARKQCVACKLARYCSASCAASDWRVHAPDCALYRRWILAPTERGLAGAFEVVKLMARGDSARALRHADVRLHEAEQVDHLDLTAVSVGTLRWMKARALHNLLARDGCTQEFCTTVAALHSRVDSRYQPPTAEQVAKDPHWMVSMAYQAAISGALSCREFADREELTAVRSGLRCFLAEICLEAVEHMLDSRGDGVTTRPYVKLVGDDIRELLSTDWWEFHADAKWSDSAAAAIAAWNPKERFPLELTLKKGEVQLMVQRVSAAVAGNRASGHSATAQAAGVAQRKCGRDGAT